MHYFGLPEHKGWFINFGDICIPLLQPTQLPHEHEYYKSQTRITTGPSIFQTLLSLSSLTCNTGNGKSPCRISAVLSKVIKICCKTLQLRRIQDRAGGYPDDARTIASHCMASRRRRSTSSKSTTFVLLNVEYSQR
jgi:hypothetical protein